MGRRYLVVSDLHLADVEDHPDGWKAYKSSRYLFDDDFADLLRRFEDRTADGDRATLILNGDILDFDIVTAVPDDPPWPVSRSERRTGLDPIEERSVWKVRRILDFHPRLVAALAGFLARSRREDGGGGRASHEVIWVLGNHDREVHFPAVQAAIREVVCARCADPIPDGALRFEPWFYCVPGDIYAEHGQQYDHYSAFRNVLCPLVTTPRGPAVAIPMGNLSGRFLTNRMGFFNPHATDFILNAFQYVAHWLKFYAFTRRSLALNWLFGSLATMARLLRLKRLLRREPRDCAVLREDLARRFCLSVDALRTLESFQRRPITDRFFRVVREFWIDRVLMAALMTGGTIALALVPVPLWVKLMVPLTGFPLVYFIYESLVAGENVFSHEQRLPGIARRIGDLMGVRVVTFGHTHRPRMVPLRKGQTFVDTGTWAPIMKRLETWRLEPGFRDYLEVTFCDDGEVVMSFDSWHASGVRVTAIPGTGDIEACKAVRREVFIVEQGVPEAEEWDGLDAECTHFLAVAGTRPVGTARLRVTPGGEARAQRVAVLRARRGQDIGRMLMEAIEREAHDRGHAEVVLEAQVQAIPFYERLGYAAEGDVFLDAGIPHRRMRKRL